MIRIKAKAKGDFKNTEGFLKKAREHRILNKLDQYGQMGVKALSEATPRRTGKTAESWYYSVRKYEDTGSFVITWSNSNVNITPHGRANIAIILDVGHATRQGGYVAGKNYIHPAIEPIFDKIAKDAWEEVTK